MVDQAPAAADVPMPEVLDAERVTGPSGEEQSPEAARLHDELVRTCEYGQALWTQLREVRAYLVDVLPGEQGSAGHAPQVNGDDGDWERWQTMYAAVTSVLVGPHGDSGFGAQEATVIAQHRMRD